MLSRGQGVVRVYKEEVDMGDGLSYLTLCNMRLTWLFNGR